MRANITRDLLKNLGNQDLTIFDTQQRGLQLRLRASGAHSWRVQRGRGDFATLGRLDALTPAAAREAAKNELTRVSADRARDLAAGLDPDEEARQRRQKRKAPAVTFTDFLEKTYEPWCEQHLRSERGTLYHLRTQFSPLLGAKPLRSIDAFTIERWRVARLKDVKPITVNKELSALKAALNRAAQWGLIRDNPLRTMKRAKEDRQGVVRYLSPAEETALRNALVARDVDRIQARENANAWRRARGYKPLPALGPFGDHLTPIVLLALNTGLRRGELLKLTWRDVDLVAARLTIRGESAKSGRTRYVPLNAEALQVFKEWQNDATGDLVFPDPNTGEQMDSLKTAWGAIIKAAAKSTATIADFRFHDLRHTFASKLIQRGVDLATVRELLGHSDFALTLRYAHLAPENTAAAVAKLVG